MAAIVRKGSIFYVVYSTYANGKKTAKWELYETASEAERRKKELECSKVNG